MLENKKGESFLVTLNVMINGVTFFFFVFNREQLFWVESEVTVGDGLQFFKNFHRTSFVFSSKKTRYNFF